MIGNSNRTAKFTNATDCRNKSIQCLEIVGYKQVSHYY